MKRLFVIAVAGVLATAAMGMGFNNNVVLAGSGVSLSGTVTGTGEIVGETFLANFNVGVFELVEEQDLSGGIVGTRSQAVPEQAAANLNTSKGYYQAIHNFEGSIAGRACTGVIVETGSFDLSTGEFSGIWDFLYNDCGYSRVAGFFSATATFTSPNTYTIDGFYKGVAKD